jgi:hypothetical protein
MNDELAFNSKIDLWLLIVLMTGVAACLWGMAVVWDSAPSLLWPLMALLAVGILIPLWVLVSLRYFLSDETLRIRCGPFKWLVPIRSIHAISRTNNLTSSPALSLDRLLVEYGDDQRIIISPEPREEFLRQLEYRRKQAG